MPTLEWSDALALSQPQMDATHQEFVLLLAEAEAAASRGRIAQLAAFAALVAHTVEHFAQEDRWMAATGFAPENCHTFQHASVLAVMREVERAAREQDDFVPLERAVAELAVWFPAHAQQMDAALAWHMAQIGYRPGDPVPQAELETAGTGLTGCGSASCA